MTLLDASPPPATAKPKLGEELPVFCERCGYSLHGLPQTRCEHCTLLQFHCPECGHHQPINTLRPAAQTILGRIRGGWLVLVIFFKINLFGWLLFAWIGMGATWSYAFHGWNGPGSVNGMPATGHAEYVPADFTWQSALAFGLFALPFGMVLRMALLRWRQGWCVGLVLSALLTGAIILGVAIRRTGEQSKLPNAYQHDFVCLMILAFCLCALGAIAVWPIWTLLVHAFLPKRTAAALLNWQCSLSENASALARPQ